MTANGRLAEELRAHALIIGEVTLTSGTTAQYYVDAKRAILRAVVQTRYPRAQMTESVATVDPDTKRALLRAVGTEISAPRRSACARRPCT